MAQTTHDRITTTIEREWLAQIVAGQEEDRIPQDQTLLDEAVREGFTPIRATPPQRDDPSRAGRHCSDPPDHQGSPCGRIQIAHQEGSEPQALGQAASEAETVSP